MGMFDSVVTPCPRCGAEIEFQSKAGECNLRTYSIQSAPPEILIDLKDNEGHCANCRSIVIMRVQAIVVATIELIR